jgi:deoxyribonuclease V
MKTLHRWDLPPEEAIKVQIELGKQVVLEWDGRPVNTIGGVDMSLTGEKAHAAIVILTFPDLIPIHGVTADAPLVFPYVPGLLSFREGPAILAAWKKLKTKPDLLMIDGQGIAHPRRTGIASQMGLWLQVPTIGVGKSRLYGQHDEVGPNKGDMVPLIERRKPHAVIGTVLRPKERTNPLFISPGHLIDVPHAIDFVLKCLKGYRLPEPTRWAHKFAAGNPLPKPKPDNDDQLSLL